MKALLSNSAISRILLWIAVKGKFIMIYTLIVVLLALWLLGFSMSVGGNLVHALLVIAAIVFLFNVVGGRRRWN
jgi:hypothetical protein